MNEAGAQTRAGASVKADAQTTEDAASQSSSPRLTVSADEQAKSALLCAQLSACARARLTHLLIGKSIIEVLFVTALVVGFIHHTFNPFFRGSVDHADARTVTGWMVDEAVPDARVEVQLYIDGHFAARGRANQSRTDVRAAGRAHDEFHGYNLSPPLLPPGEHEARVYAVHTSGSRIILQQVDKSLRFIVPASNENKAIADAWWEAARP
jgi:hypothetical protein